MIFDLLGLVLKLSETKGHYIVIFDLAEALNENTSQKDISKALHPDKGAHLLFASLEYLLVDKGHVIHDSAERFRKDYGELKTLRITLVGTVPWWAVSAMFKNSIFETVCKTLGFGTSRPFWGTDVGTEQPNRAQYVQPLESAANSHFFLILLIPERRRPGTISQRWSCSCGSPLKPARHVPPSVPSSPPICI